MTAKTGLALAALILGGLASGQAMAAKAPPAGSPQLRDSRVPAGVPNISGVWVNKNLGVRVGPNGGGDPPWQPWAGAVFRDRAKQEAEGTPMWDPTGACWGSGMPRILVVGYPIEIVQTEDRVVWMDESQHVFRVVRMNAAHRKDFKRTFMGDPVGHWEGDTLVIDTVGFSGKAQMDERGTPMTDQMHMVERVKRVGDHLEDTYTIDDPGAYTRPWTQTRVLTYSPEERLQEYVCEENNRNTPGDDGKITTKLKASK